jgi:NodT family efflux transporter outer membrane factor (OMF) lipoprotein
VQAYKESLRIAQNQAAAGVTTLADVYSARTQLETTVAQENTVELSRANFAHAIAVLIGKPPARLTLAQAKFASTVPVVPTGVPATLLLRRPDIAASERDLQAANAQIGIAESAWFPSLTLSGSYGSQADALSSLFKASNAVWSFGPSIAESLFNGGATVAQTREERALYDAAVASYRQTVLGAFQQVENDLATLHYLQTEYAQQSQAVREAERSQALYLNQYKAGVVAYTTVLTAQTTLLNAEVTALNVQSQRLVASVDLIDAIGGGWSSAELRRGNEGVTETLKSTVD